MSHRFRSISHNFIFLRIFNELVDFTWAVPHSPFRRLTPRFPPSCFHSASTDGRDRNLEADGTSGSRLMPKLTKRTVDAAEVRSSDYFVWDDDLPGFGLRVVAKRPQGLRRPVPRRAPLAEDQPRAEHRTCLRAGAQPSNHDRRRGEERRRPCRQARCRSGCDTIHGEPGMICVAGRIPLSTRLFADPTQIPSRSAAFIKLII